MLATKPISLPLHAQVSQKAVPVSVQLKKRRSEYSFVLQSRVPRCRLARASGGKLSPSCSLDAGFTSPNIRPKRNWSLTAATADATTDNNGGLGAAIKAIKSSIMLWCVNVYLNLFGGEKGLNFLVQRGFPSKMRSIFAGLYECYKQQVIKSLSGNVQKASEKTARIFREMIRAYAGQLLGTPYIFPSYHQAIREGSIDYFQLGNDYVGTLINYDQSVLGQKARWDDVEKKINAGENVILLANHQSEADAAFIPLLTEKSHPGLGEKVIYVAGGRVVDDIMSKPFSMGRNLLCVNSKKHMMEGDRSAKMRQNIRTLKEMERLLQAGGALIWIAPSGGRDRRSPDGTLVPDPFDPDAIEMMRKLGTKKGVKPTTFYPMAMATFDIMPPPSTVGGALGEERIVNYTGVGLSLGETVDVSPDARWAEGVEADGLKSALAQHVYDRVFEEYQTIEGCMVSVDKEFSMPIGGVRPQDQP